MTTESISAQIARLQTLPVAELREEYQRVYGEPARSRNRVWLWRRIAWRIQELEYGGLSERARKRLQELMPTAELALRTSPTFRPEVAAGSAPVRDTRIPRPGTTLLRTYKGQRIAVTVLKDGFEWEGRVFNSLSAVANAVTGSRWNGLLFFRIAKKDGK